MFEERIQQYFCTEEQHAANVGKSPPEKWGLVPREKEWDEYEPACVQDSDCPRPDLGQQCTLLLWEATNDGKNWTNGETCLNMETPTCPGPEYGAINYNYDSTQFSYRTMERCTSGESAASTLLVSAAALLTAMSLF